MAEASAWAGAAASSMQVHIALDRRGERVGKYLLMDEIHISIMAPRGMPVRKYRAIRRTLKRAGFERRLREAVRAVIRHYPALTNLRMVISR